jgi:hypothetical protein
METAGAIFVEKNGEGPGVRVTKVARSNHVLRALNGLVRANLPGAKRLVGSDASGGLCSKDPPFG